MFFVNRYLGRLDGVFVIDGFVKETENEALHQFHSVMNTYAYGQNENYNYVMCEVKTPDGRVIKGEVDNRLDAPVAPVEEPSEE